MDADTNQIVAFGASQGAVVFVEGDAYVPDAGLGANGLYTVTAGNTPVRADPNATPPMVVDSGRVYYATPDGVRRLDLGTSTITTLVPSPFHDGGKLTNLAVYGSDLYFATEQCIYKVAK